MNLKYLDLAIESLQSLIVFLLFSFHIFRSDRIKKHRESTDDTTFSSSLLRIIKLKHVSYLILSVYLFKGLFNLIKSMLDIIISDISYNDNLCTIFQNIDITLGIIGRFGIHLFVATRSRLSSTKQKLSIWFKIGLLLILTDIGLILLPQIINALHAIYLNGICVLISYHPILLCWVLFSDFVIGIYSLFVFVLPIKKVLKSQRNTSCSNVKVTGIHNPSCSNLKVAGIHNYSASNLSINYKINFKATRSNSSRSIPGFTPTSNSNASSDSKSKSKSNFRSKSTGYNGEIAKFRSLDELVHKVILCSSIMLVSSMLIIVIALIFSVSQFKNAIILSLLPPIDNILNSWCIILQFADIRIDSMQSIYGRIIVAFCQCNYCDKQCCCYFCNNGEEQKQDITEEIYNICNDPGITEQIRVNMTINEEENELNQIVAPLQIGGELVDTVTTTTTHLAITPADSMCDVQSTQYMD